MGVQDQGRPAHRARERALSPEPPFGKALGDFVENLTDKKRKLTQERVDSVLATGQVVIRGNILPVTGRVPIIAGETVVVAWKDGKMELVMLNQGRRGGAAALTPVGGQIVEMLVMAPLDATSANTQDIWFRNSEQVTLLKSNQRTCREQLTDAGFVIGAGSYTLFGWGMDHRRFVVGFTNLATVHPVLAVFKLAGDERTPITGTATAKLESTEDIGASALSFGTMTWFQAPSLTLTTPLQLGTLLSTGYAVFTPSLALAQTADASISEVVLTRERHLIVSVRVRIVDQDNSLAGFGSVNFFYPFVVDLTAGTVLFNGITSQGIWPGGVYDGAHFINLGVGAFDRTSPTSKIGGAEVRMVPTRRGNPLRVFAAVRASAFGVIPGTGSAFQWTGTHVLGDPASATTIFQIQDATTDGSHIWPITWRDRRYVLWARAAGSSTSFGGFAIQDPFASALTQYSFKEGLHVTDLGTGETIDAAKVLDTVVLTDRDLIIAFLDTTPFLTSVALLYQDFTDLRIRRPRVTPHFSVFRNARGVITPFPAPLPTVGELAAVDDLKAFTADQEFILTDIADDYRVSGHSDPVVGYSVLNARAFVQVLPLDGLPIPTA